MPMLIAGFQAINNRSIPGRHVLCPLLRLRLLGIQTHEDEGKGRKKEWAIKFHAFAWTCEWGSCRRPHPPDCACIADLHGRLSLSPAWWVGPFTP
ncbi:hypothetical protein V6N13_107905 [Hibiscus sabdariffa]|uniref:Uncharacterized protein n=1 Tax=Hibiscus sabdariffa TaxID=183260 RepID=A0ABR2SQM1_9ROSI